MQVVCHNNVRTIAASSSLDIILLKHNLNHKGQEWVSAEEEHARSNLIASVSIPAAKNSTTAVIIIPEQKSRSLAVIFKLFCVPTYL